MQRGSVWKWTRRAGALLISFLLFAILFGMLVQAFTRRFDSAANPPGRRIDVGGYRLHLYCEGRGNPTIVVIPGVGVWSVQWRKIQDALAQQTRFCAYDRAGYGWSDFSPSPATADQAALQLYTLLAAAGEPGPYVLVGESYGGYVTRLFTDKFIASVAGIVLVESAHERQWDEIPEAKALVVDGEKQLQVAHWLSYTGLFRLWPMDRGEDLPPNARRDLLATEARTQTFVAWRNELAGAFTSARQVAATRSLGDLPLVVVSATRSFNKFFPDDSKEVTGPMNEKWMRLQNELAALSTNSLHLVNPTATHAIAREQPDFVIDAIRRALAFTQKFRKPLVE
jgi:pimeloyl-ACP methyl ester carboxylesterase